MVGEEEGGDGGGEGAGQCFIGGCGYDERMIRRRQAGGYEVQRILDCGGAGRGQ